LRVALVRPPLLSRAGAFNNEAVPHLGMAYVAGYLRARGHAVAFLDGIAEGLNQVHALAELPGFQIQGITLEELVGRLPADTQVVGFSSMFSAEWVLLRRLIEIVRARFPRALLIGGGEHFTALPEYCLRDCPALDLIVKGEGEQTFASVLEAWAASDYGAVAGIAFLAADGGYHDNGGQPRVRAIDELPWPWWPEGYLEKFWAAGKSYGIRTERDIPLLATRGCPYRCTFCSSPQMWTTRYVMREIDDLIAEIKYYIAHYQITSFQFYDLTAFTRRAWTLAFCRRLAEENLGVRWSLPSGTRSEVLDEEILTLLKATGCDYIAYAPESGSPTTLARIKKRVRLARMVNSIRTARRLGLTVRTNLIIGFPDESRREVFETIRFGLKMALIGVDEVPFFIFSAYPGTEIFADLVQRGEVVLNDAYFLSLVSLNGKFSNLCPAGVSSRHLSNVELATLRLAFMLLNYAISYLCYPRRILRTLRNLSGRRGSATVFENRLQDALHRGRASAPP
jgi:radical SAM superfamily enzyme YgiQ (UPF0313 family)